MTEIQFELASKVARAWFDDEDSGILAEVCSDDMSNSSDSGIYNRSHTHHRLNYAGYQVIYFLEGGTAKRYLKSFLTLKL